MPLKVPEPNKVKKVKTKAGTQYRVQLKHIIVHEDNSYDIEDGEWIQIDVGKNRFALNVWKHMARFVDEQGHKIIPPREVVEQLRKDYEVTFIHTGHRGVEARVVLKRFKKIDRLFKDLPHEKKIARFKLLMRRKVADFREYGFKKIRVVDIDEKDKDLADGVIWVTKSHRNLVGAEVKGYAKGTIDIIPDRYKRKFKVKKDEVIVPSINVKIRNPKSFRELWIAEFAKTRLVVKNEFEYGIAAMINKPLPAPKVTWNLSFIASLVDTKTGITNMASAMMQALVPLDWIEFINMTTPMVNKQISRLFRVNDNSVTAFGVALPIQDENVLDEVHIPKSVAKQLMVREGDTVILTRNPIPGLVGLVRVTVKITDEDVIRVPKKIWTKVLKGDYDGDLAQIIVNKIVIEKGMDPKDSLEVAESYEIKKEENGDPFESDIDAYMYTITNAGLVGPLTIRWYEKFDKYHKIKNKKKRALEMLKGFEEIQQAIDGMKHRVGNANMSRRENPPDPWIQLIRGRIGTENINLSTRVREMKNARKNAKSIWERIVASRKDSLPDFSMLDTRDYDVQQAAIDEFEYIKDRLKKKYKRRDVDYDLDIAIEFIEKYHRENGWSMEVTKLIPEKFKRIRNKQYKKILLAFAEAIRYKRGIARASVIHLNTARRISAKMRKYVIREA